MSNEQIKKAFGDAEKELQQEEIDKIKSIVRSYLEEIQDKQDKKNRKQKEVDEIDEEIRLLKKDLDDLKAGRLDKMEERQKVDKRARDISIIIIKKVEKEYVPYKPWYSPYDITWNPKYQYIAPNNDGQWYTKSDAGTVTTTSSSWDSPLMMLSGPQSLLDNSASAFNSNVVNSNSLNQVMDNMIRTTGSLMSNFVGGSYDINGKITNL
jgi:hypothetical protein